MGAIETKKKIICFPFKLSAILYKICKVYTSLTKNAFFSVSYVRMTYTFGKGH